MELNKDMILQLLKSFLKKEEHRMRNSKSGVFATDITRSIIEKINNGENYFIEYPFSDIINIGTTENYNVSILDYQKFLTPILREKKLKRLNSNI